VTVGNKSHPILRFLTLAALAVFAAGCVSSPAPGLALADEYFNLGNTWFDLKKYDQAAKAYQKALTWNPSLKVASVNLARTRAETGDPAGALALLGPLADADPDNLVLAQYRAWLTAKKDGAAGAADLYAALSAKVPGDAATQFNAGLSLKAAGRNEEAVRAWKAWKALDGKSSVGLTALAEVLTLSQSPEAAGAWLDVAASYPEGDVKRFAPLAARGKALATAESFAEAIQAWDAALALPAAPDQGRGEVKFLRGRVLLLKVQDLEAGSQGVVDAWKDGYKDAAAWKALRTDPELTFATQLEAALSAAGVSP